MSIEEATRVSEAAPTQGLHHEQLDKYVKMEGRMIGDKKLSSNAKCVYMALKIHDFSGKGTAYPSYPRIAEILGVSRRTAIQGVKDLEAAGYIKVTRKTNRSNVYHFPEWCTKGTPVVQEMHLGSALDAPEREKGKERNLNKGLYVVVEESKDVVDVGIGSPDPLTLATTTASLTTPEISISVPVIAPRAPAYDGPLADLDDGLGETWEKPGESWIWSLSEERQEEIYAIREAKARGEVLPPKPVPTLKVPWEE